MQREIMEHAHSTSLSCIAKIVNTETMRIKLYCSKSKAERQQKLIRGRTLYEIHLGASGEGTGSDGGAVGGAAVT